jgi:hypothetical protein
LQTRHNERQNHRRPLGMVGVSFNNAWNQAAAEQRGDGRKRWSTKSIDASSRSAF